ncbi:MAG: dihydropteroate synthase [Desulfobacteraceae bacterium]|nr:dihydropteroate synthase [Desulfobacteraceae bacterium]MBC2756642.1 dihydropteroate synthase [Desulfobacteraceae bacterium]
MILVADNLQITNQTIESAINQLNPVPIQELVRQCESAGAQAIDINPGPLTRNPEKKMTFLVETVQSVTQLPLLLDTANHKALKAGLMTGKNHPSTPIINGFSLEPKKLEHILPLAKKFRSKIIGYLLYPNSHVPIDEADCIHVALALYQEFSKAGLENEQLIIDPVVAPVVWENGIRHNMSMLSVMRNLPDLLDFSVQTIAGISNLTTGKIPKEKKQILEQSFFPILAASGLSMALLNVFHSQTMQTARACDALLSPEIFSWTEIST